MLEAERRAVRAMGARLAAWGEPPQPGLANPFLLPVAAPGMPVVALGVGAGGAPLPLATVRAQNLHWPATRAGALEAALAVDLRAVPEDGIAALLDAAEALAPQGGARAAVGTKHLALAEARGYAIARDLASLDPAALRVLLGATAAPYWAALGGRLGFAWRNGEALPVDPRAWAARVRFRDPWRGGEMSPEAGIAALIELRRAAQRNDRPTFTAGFSPWKRRNTDPFLTGPDGPPRHFRRLSQAARAAEAAGGRLALWGNRDAEGAPVPVIRVEDGFVRSVGLGLRHAPPASLAVDALGLYFDATRETSFEKLACETAYDAGLTARAATLRENLVALRITKYNLAAGGARAALPDTTRERLLVPGQVEGDASLIYGSPDLKTNAALLRAARARNPAAFILYKPHPDVLQGRPGAVDDATLAACADAVILDAPAEACLDWADGIETMTSLMGFEALLRGRRVATHGRPFYAGWGLTESAGTAFARPRELTLDQLTAAALILYPRYIDPETRLPCPVERVLEALAEERGAARGLSRRLRDAGRAATSRLLNALR